MFCVPCGQCYKVGPAAYLSLPHEFPCMVCFPAAAPQTRVKAARDAALAARVEQLRRGGGAESDEENPGATSKQTLTGSADAKPGGERDNDDLGLRRCAL